MSADKAFEFDNEKIVIDKRRLMCGMKYTRSALQKA